MRLPEGLDPQPLPHGSKNEILLLEQKTPGIYSALGGSGSSALAELIQKQKLCRAGTYLGNAPVGWSEPTTMAKLTKKVKLCL